MESKKEVMHTQEPWRLEKAEPERPGNYYVLAPDMNLAIARVYENAGEANARRIVACVNACAGLSTEALEETARLHAAVGHEFDGLQAQRDELLAALKGLYEMVSDNFHVDDSMMTAYGAAYDAIAKCEVKS